MAIPKYNELYDAVLEELSDGQEYLTKDIKLSITNKLDLTEDEKLELLPSKSTTVINSRIGWAITYLKKAEFLESRKRGWVNITKLGLEMFNTESHITEDILIECSDQFFEWLKNSKSLPKSLREKYDFNKLTPEEEIENSVNKINDELSNQILKIILNGDELLFKRIVFDLLLKMDYKILNSGVEKMPLDSMDDSIDAIISKDNFGINKFAIQARKSNSKIEKSVLQSFVGACMGNGLNNGVFLTNSSFTNDALDFSKNQSISLIDGDKLVDLMIEYNVGTFTIHTYEIKSIDNEYFNI